MANKWTLKREADYRNRERNVEKISSVDAAAFCANTQGDFFITGGSADKRAAIILDYIRSRRNRNSHPIVILSGSEILEKKLIENISCICDSLSVISESYKSYACFCGMSDPAIINCISRVAEIMGISDLLMLRSYTKVFLMLLRSYGFNPELNAMLALSRNSEEQLVAAARAKGFEAYLTDILFRDREGLRSLRNVLLSIKSAVEKIHSEGRSNKSLITLFDNRDVIFLSVNSDDPKVMNEILAAELSQLSNRPMTLIMDEVPLVNNSSMLSFLEKAGATERIELGVSLVNANTWLENDRTIFDKKSLVIMPSGMGVKDINTILSIFGKYTHYWVEMTIPAKKFELWHDKTYTILHEERDRVRYADTGGCEAVLSGHNGSQILLAGNLFSTFEGGNINEQPKRIQRI